MRIHQCRIQVWNIEGIALDVEKLVKPDAVVWKGDSSLPKECQGIRVLAAPIGTLEHVAGQFAHKSREQDTVFMRMPT